MKAKFNRKDQFLANDLKEFAIAEVYIASEAVFDSFCRKPLADYIFIKEFGSRTCTKDGVEQCLLLLGENRSDGVLIQCEGASYARYTSYLPGASQLWDGIVQGIVQDIFKEAKDGWAQSWLGYDSFSKYGLKLNCSSNATHVLVDRLRAVPELTLVEIGKDDIFVVASPEFAKAVQQMQNPDTFDLSQQT